MAGGTGKTSRAQALYCLNRFVLWRKKNGLNANPDAWVADCQGGTVRTLTNHLQTLKDWIKSSEFYDSSKETRRKAWFRIRGLYEGNNVPLPAVKLRLPQKGVQQVKVEITAIEFLGMITKVLSAGHLTIRDKSVILTMLQSGMDASTCACIFNLVGFPQLVSHFGTEGPLIPGLGYDIALLFNIIHGLLPEKNKELLHKVARSLDTGGMLVIFDQFIGDAFGPVFNTRKACCQLTFWNIDLAT
jgi:hypothetical protein